jgi:hypothetical protein
MAVNKDTTAPLEMRLDAAKAAIRFEKPALCVPTSLNGGAVSNASAPDAGGPYWSACNDALMAA